MIEKRYWPQQAIVAFDDGFLIKSCQTGLGVERGLHEVPHRREKWLLGLKAIDYLPTADTKLQTTVLIDAQTVALAATIVPPSDQALAARKFRQRWINKGKYR